MRNLEKRNSIRLSDFKKLSLHSISSLKDGESKSISIVITIDNPTFGGLVLAEIAIEIKFIKDYSESDYNEDTYLIRFETYDGLGWSEITSERFTSAEDVIDYYNDLILQ